MLALNGTGSNLEIGKAMTTVFTISIDRFPWCVPRIPHRPDACRR